MNQVRSLIFILREGLFAISIVILVSCSQNRAPEQRSTIVSENDLRKLYERLMDASKGKGDEKILRQVLADDYTQVTASGDRRDKEKRISDTLSGESPMTSYVIEEFRPRIYGDSAIAVCRVRLKGLTNGGTYDSTVLSTATFVRKDNVWRIAATHLTFPPEYQPTIER